MLAVIRTCPKRIAHCTRTVENLLRSNGDDEQRIQIVCSTKKPNFNGLDCIQAGIDASGGEPFIFLEDDLDFIACFSQAAQQFYRDCEGVDSLILPLCANYTEALRQCRGIAWPYRTKAYYGSQAFVISHERAKDFVTWTKERAIPSVGFDLLVKAWAEDRGHRQFLTPYVSFVQHMGVDSAMHNGRFFWYETWPGRDWLYTSSAFSLKEQAKRPCDIALAAAIAEFFGPTLSAYDFGCSTGNYVRELRKKGIITWGFDATPGIASQFVKEVDLSRVQKFDEPQGNVMCLEVAEHIHPELEPNLIDNIRFLCAGKLVLSWAVPGQGGKRHVNERDRAYVIQRIESAGFQLDLEQTTKMRQVATIPWFRNTVFAFQRKP